jgi:sugar-specific transcriptional regulator TrmB
VKIPLGPSFIPGLNVRTVNFINPPFKLIIPKKFFTLVKIKSKQRDVIFLFKRVDDMEKAESLLRDIGLKEYEAKAFTAVVQCGVCSADQVSKISHIPLTRVYETMQSLQKLGIVTVLNTRPKKYRLVSVDALSNLIENKKRLMSQELERSETIIKEIKSMVPKATLGDSDEIKEGFWIIKGREPSARKIMDEERKAEKEILFFSDDYSWFPKFRKLLESKINQGITVKVLVNLNEKTMKTVSELISIGADVRGWDAKNLRGDIIDSKLIHLVSQMPKPGINPEDHYGREGSDELFFYDCLTTGNPIIVNMVKTYFDIFWWRGERPQALLASNHRKTRFK